MRGANFPPVFTIPARMMFGIFKPRKTRPGWELSGVIESVGSDVKNFKAGDEVIATTTGLSGGSYADYIAVPEDRKTGILIKKAANVSHGEAAASQVGGLTALYFLRKAYIRNGDKVLIYGASGSLGTFAIQLANNLGAEVTAVCSTENVELVKSLGADHVIDYKKEDYAEMNQKWDVIFDTVGKAKFGKAIKSLAEDGVYLMAAYGFKDILGMILYGITGRKKVIGGMATEKNEDAEFLAGLMNEGKLKSVIDKTWPLEEIVEAHRYVDTGRKRGNVSITINNE
jgi:NADPH:quinone reductase-like Zn-dependent oxidoreductase